MRYESDYCYNKYDFLVILANFAIRCGWEIKKQTTDELYLYSSEGGYFNISLALSQFGSKIGSTGWGGEISGASGFDESLEFRAQPGCFTGNTFNNVQNYEQKIYFNQELPHLRSYAVLGDKKTLFVNIDLDTNMQYSFFTSFINKTHDFNGGGVVYSKFQKAPYSASHCPGIIGNFFVPVLLGGNYDYHTSTFFSLGGKWHGLNYSNANVITNLGVEKGQNAVFKLAINAQNITTSVKKSKYTGLNPVIVPQFFYKNELGKYIHAGHLQDILITTSKGLENKQILHLGGEKFIVFLNSYLGVIGYKIEFNQKYSSVYRDESYAFLLRLDNE